jgi:hypothetical protein
LPDGVTAKVSLTEGPTNSNGRTWSAEIELTAGDKVTPGFYEFMVTGKPLIVYRNNPEAADRAKQDQDRVTQMVESFKSQRGQLVAAAGAAVDASSPEIKRLDDQIARGEAALKEATDRATKVAAAAQPADRRTYIVSNVGTLHVKETPKE